MNQQEEPPNPLPGRFSFGMSDLAILQKTFGFLSAAEEALKEIKEAEGDPKLHAEVQAINGTEEEIRRAHATLFAQTTQLLEQTSEAELHAAHQAGILSQDDLHEAIETKRSFELLRASMARQTSREQERG